jgi:hypothetical protein
MTRHIVRLDTLEQERREVLNSVLQGIANNHPDPDRTAACMYLIRHLATPVRPAPAHPATPTAVAPPPDARRSEARCR